MCRAILNSTKNSSFFATVDSVLQHRSMQVCWSSWTPIYGVGAPRKGGLLPGPTRCTGLVALGGSCCLGRASCLDWPFRSRTTARRHGTFTHFSHDDTTRCRMG